MIVLWVMARSLHASAARYAAEVIQAERERRALPKRVRSLFQTERSDPLGRRRPGFDPDRCDRWHRGLPQEPGLRPQCARRRDLDRDEERVYLAGHRIRSPWRLARK